MTNYRKELLDKIAQEQGLETPITIAISLMSDLFPNSCHDNMIANFYEVWRLKLMFCEEQEEQEEQDDIPEDNMNEDADAYEDIIANLYEWMEMDE